MDMPRDPELNADYDGNKVPKADSLINVNVTCDGGSAGEEGAAGAGGGANGSTPSASSSSSPCSDGSLCINGYLGVYCLCYLRESALEEVRVEEIKGGGACPAESAPALLFIRRYVKNIAHIPHTLRVFPDVPVRSSLVIHPEIREKCRAHPAHAKSFSRCPVMRQLSSSGMG